MKLQIFLTAILTSSLASAEILASYNASRVDVVETTLGRAAGGLQNLAGWDDANWPSGQAQNSSCFFTTGKDPQGRPAAHVHKSAHFARSEYHVLADGIDQDKTYYIGYKVQWVNVDYQTIVFQWKGYDTADGINDDIPIALVFRADASGGQNHTINFGCQTDPSSESSGKVQWTKALTMGEIYQFGIVVNTTPSVTGGWTQLYFNGKLATLTDSNGEHVTKLAGNFFPTPGYANPKLGLYGGKNNLADDSYVYDFVVGTELGDIAEVAGIEV